MFDTWRLRQATSNTVLQSVDTGSVSNIKSLGKATRTRAAIGAVILGGKCPRITTGRNSYSAIAKSTQTKLNSKTISNVSPKTVGKAIGADVAVGTNAAIVAVAVVITAKKKDQQKRLRKKGVRVTKRMSLVVSLALE